MPHNSIELDIRYHLDAGVDDSHRFQQAAQWIVEKFHLQQFVCSISIVDDETIQVMNREHLAHDWPTDVISFEFERKLNCADGEIIASWDTARRLHAQARWSTEDELLLYVVHGMLHLAGLDDQDDQQRLEMRRHEQECLSCLGVAGASNHLARWEDVSY